MRLVARIDSDRRAFLAELEADRSAAALEHYGGDFFPDFAAPGGAGFEQWADLERARLRALFLGAATRVVRDRLSKGLAREAISIARRAQALAPHHQAAWRLLLESYLAADDPIGAAVEVERLERWLSDDELEPDTATLQLMKAVRSGKSNGNGNGATPDEPTASRGLHAELVGRESEFAELLAMFEATKRGQSRHVHIAAPAGFGKTRLLDGFAARLRSSRVRVITVRATPAERSLPYAFAAQLVSALVQLRGASAVSPDTARALIALAPTSSSYLSAEPDRSSGDEALRRRSLAVTELVTTIAHDAPLVLLVDDVHWMDTQSRTLLASLATRLESAPVLLVTTARTADRFAEGTPTAHRLALRPLSVDDIGGLVMSLGQLPVEPWSQALIDGLHETSSGSPLLVLETLQLVMELDQLRLTEHHWSTPDASALIATLGAGRAMQRRLTSLPASARDALLRLAVAGTEVDEQTLPHLLSQDGRESVALLETRGLVTRIDGVVGVAHDEIAALAVDMASEANRMRANEIMASHLERIARDDVSLLLRAAWHRARCSDTDALDITFARAVRSAHLSGEHTAIRALGREVLGTDADARSVEQLVRRLPWRMRTRQRWVIGALVTAAIILMAVVMRQSMAAPGEDITAVMIATDADGSAFYTLTIPRGDLSNDDAIELTATGEAFPISVTDTVSVMGRLSNGQFVGSSLLDNDATQGLDLVQISPSGDVKRMLTLNNDQDSPVPSPDGRLIAFTSGHWHAAQRADIAVYEPSTNTTRNLTDSSDASEYSPIWNANGSRIAFLRSHATERSAQVCWVALDKSSMPCRELGSGYTPIRVIAWRSDRSLLVTAERRPGNVPMLLDVDMEGGAPTVLDSSATRYVADPSGRVVHCLCSVPGFSGRVLAVFSPNTPAIKRVIRRNNRPIRSYYTPYVHWQKPSRDLASIAILGPPTSFVGQRLQLGITGTDSTGSEREVTSPSWKSLDTSTAVIDRLGVAFIRAIGAASFQASADGIVSPVYTTTVRPPESHPEFSENWSLPLSKRWIEYGTPPAQVVRSGAHRSLHLAGDGHLTSGVISQATIDARTGAGIRVWVRTPIRIAQWQALTVTLDAIASNAALAEWRERSRLDGALPMSWSAYRINRGCFVRAPRAEFGENLSLLGLNAADEDVPIPAIPSRLTDGLPHTIVLQILGDGRCGLAIDDQVVAISANSVKTDRPLRVQLDGQSVGTTILVDSLETWSGIRTSIDWGAPVTSPRTAVRTSAERR
ncbi:MAG: AAA family ATPase [Gemmatimonas sp.]